MRSDSFHKIEQEQLSQPEQPLHLELYPSNICNLKCRICGPYNSSRWISEAKETLGITEKVYNNLTPENMDLFSDWLPNLKELNVVGGEPLLLREYKQLLDLAIEGNYSKNIALFTTTNGTIYSEELVGLLQHFKKVHLTFSIDDIGQRFEYQRKGATWQPVIDNIQEFAKHGGFSAQGVGAILLSLRFLNASRSLPLRREEQARHEAEELFPKCFALGQRLNFDQSLEDISRPQIEFPSGLAQ